MTKTHVPQIHAILPLELVEVFMHHGGTVQIIIYVPMIYVTQREHVYQLLKIVMILIHVPLIHAIPLETADTVRYNATIIIHVPQIHAMPSLVLAYMMPSPKEVPVMRWTSVIQEPATVRDNAMGI
jgi:hypothetical protein